MPSSRGATSCASTAAASRDGPGPSGSGESTLLTLAGGLDAPTGGTVAVGGRDLARLSRAQLAALRRRSVGYVFQDFNLIPALI